MLSYYLQMKLGNNQTKCGFHRKVRILISELQKNPENRINYTVLAKTNYYYPDSRQLNMFSQEV